MSRRTRAIQSIIDIALASLGIWAGVATSSLVSVQAFKLLNIAGLSFDLFGVLLLTYVVATSERFKEFVVEWGGVVGVAITGFFLIGFYVGLFFGSVWLGGEDHGLFSDLFPVLMAGMASAFFLEDTVMIPKLAFLRNNETRLKFLGGYFILAGIIIQIHAAFLDLRS